MNYDDTSAPYPVFDGTQPCADVDPESFHLDLGQQVDAAKRICNGDPKAGKAPCPFLDPCLQYALHHSVSGVWGATSDQERRAMRRKLRIVAEPLSFGTGPTNSSTAKRMAGRGTPVSVIAAHLGVTAEAVHRILRGADANRAQREPGGIAPRSTCEDCGASMRRSSLGRHRSRCVGREDVAS